MPPKAVKPSAPVKGQMSLTSFFQKGPASVSAANTAVKAPPTISQSTPKMGEISSKSAELLKQEALLSSGATSNDADSPMMLAEDEVKGEDKKRARSNKDAKEQGGNVKKKIALDAGSFTSHLYTKKLSHTQKAPHTPPPLFHRRKEEQGQGQENGRARRRRGGVEREQGRCFLCKG